MTAGTVADGEWQGFCRAVGQPEWTSDERFATTQARVVHVKERLELMSRVLKERSTAEWLERLDAEQVPCAPILSVAETVHHPHLRARGTVVTHNDKLFGEFDMPGFPLRFSDFPDPLPLEAATLGEHNGEVVTELLGHSEDELETLRKDGVLVEKKEC